MSGVSGGCVASHAAACRPVRRITDVLVVAPACRSFSRCPLSWRRSPTTQALKLPRREPDPALEDASEVAHVAEPDLDSHPLDGPVGGAKQHPCPVDPLLMDAVGEGLVERLPELASKVVSIAGKRVSDPRGAKVGVGEVVGDECCCPPG